MPSIEVGVQKSGYNNASTRDLLRPNPTLEIDSAHTTLDRIGAPLYEWGGKSNLKWLRFVDVGCFNNCRWIHRFNEVCN